MTLQPDNPWLQLIGRMHPLMLHLPIGLWFGVAVVELSGAVLRRKPRQTNDGFELPMAVTRQASYGSTLTLAWLAAVTGAFAACSGWILGGEGEHNGSNFELHRWLGVAVAVIGLATAIAAGFTARRAFRSLLIALMLVLMPTGHLGGSMTHGADFLTAPFDAKSEVPDSALGVTTGVTTGVTGAAAGVTGAVTGVTGAVTGALGAVTFAQVKVILTRTCVPCHNAEKHKGDLQLIDRSTIERGGKEGSALNREKLTSSPLLLRILLPLDEDDHMPKKGKPQPTPAEIEMLRAWLAAGAPFDDAVTADTKQQNTPAHSTGDVPSSQGETSKEPARDVAPLSTADSSNSSASLTQAARKSQDSKTRGSDPNSAAITALLVRQIAMQEVPGTDGFEINFAAVANAITAAEATSLLTPLAARVYDLSLARVSAGDELCALCAQMPHLARLDLSATQVTEQGLAKLIALAQLRELVLVQTKLGDGAVEPLLMLPALTKVYVWHSGLTPEAVTRLREKKSLSVDAGDTKTAPALEVEGELKFVNELPLFGKPPPEKDPVALLTPVNDICPVTGKPIDARFIVVHQQQAIGFCCMNCPKTFWTDPAKFVIKPK